MKKKAIIYIVLAGLLWGTSGLFVNILSPFGFSSVQLTAVRGVISALIMTVYVLIYDRRLFKINLPQLVLCFFCGLTLFVTAASYYSSMKACSVSTAVTLMYTAPVFVMAFSVVYWKEKLSAIKIVSIVAMLVGCALVSGIVGDFKFSLAGFGFGVLSGLSYGTYSVFTKLQYIRGTNPLTATVYAFYFMAIISTVVCNPVEAVGFIAADPLKILPLFLAFGACTFVIPYFLYNLSLGDLPASVASALSIIEPLAATVYSIVLLGEQLTIFSIFGIVLILGSVFLISRGEKNE